jgi:predicted transcriptional regulator
MSMAESRPICDSEVWEPVAWKMLKLASQDRLLILELLSHGAMTAHEIRESLGYHESAVAHHLRALLHVGFVLGEFGPEDDSPGRYLLSSAGWSASEFASDLKMGV